MTEESRRQSIWSRHLPPWVLVIVILVVVAVLFFGPFHHGGHSRELAKRVVCMTNLRGVGIGVALYHVDHNDLDPVDWGELLNSDYFEPEMLVCPSSGTERSVDTMPADLERRVDYVLVSGMGGNAPGDSLRAFELPRNDSQGIANMLYTDTRVSGILDFSEFMQQLQQVNDHLAELRREAP